MADNVTLNTGSGGSTLATEDEAGVHYQNVKLTASGSGTTAVLSRAEDAAHTSGDHGIMALVVRNDTLAALAGTDGDYAPLQVNATGALYVSVDGTVTVGSHAVTNAGTFAVQVDGAALTALQLIDDAIYADDADWTDSTSKHALVGGLYQSSPQTVTDGDVAPFNITVNGALHTAVQNTVTVASHAVTNAGTFAVQSTLQAGTAEVGKLAAGVAEIGNVKNSGTFAVQSTLQAGTAEVGKLAAGVAEIGNVKNSGTFVTQIDGAALTALQLIDNSIAVLGTATYTETSTSGTVIGAVRNDALATLADTDNEIAPLQVNASGAVYVQNTPSTTGGLSFFKSIDLDESEEEVKGSAGQLYFVHAMNLKASVLYLKVYNNTAAGTTVGTTVPDWTFALPTQGDTNGAGTIIPIPMGMDCTVGITMACTTGVADNDAGAPGANECVVNVAYK